MHATFLDDAIAIYANDDNVLMTIASKINDLKAEKDDQTSSERTETEV